MSADTNTIAVFPPGEFIKDELEARGWSQSDLADILDRSQKLVSEIVSGKRAITPETAAVLGEAFGTGAQVWLNLESAYRLSLTRGSDGRVTRKAPEERATEIDGAIAAIFASYPYRAGPGATP